MGTRKAASQHVSTIGLTLCAGEGPREEPFSSPGGWGRGVLKAGRSSGIGAMNHSVDGYLTQHMPLASPCTRNCLLICVRVHATASLHNTVARFRALGGWTTWARP